jgi:hypothetical protein
MGRSFEMRKIAILAGLVLGSVVGSGIIHCSSVTCEEDQNCKPPDAYIADADSGSVGCDPSATATCITNDIGIFVDGDKGIDSNDGTMQSPVKTIKQAIAMATLEKSSVFVCKASQAYGPVSLAGVGVSLYGGFACGDSSWTYDDNQIPQVLAASGNALRISDVPSAIVIQDMEFESQGAQGAGNSSIAIFVVNSAVSFRHITAKAGDGVAGAKAESTPLNYSADTALGSKPGNATGAGGEGPKCQCNDNSFSIGGNGGAGGDVGGDGSSGSASWSAAGGPVTWPIDSETGHGGNGYKSPTAPDNLTACNADIVTEKVNQVGGNALEGGIADPAMDSAGVLSSTTWTPADGSDGTNGNPGQGGGGGGGGSSGGGASGACGGCGGGGGYGGKGGGSSIAIASYQSTISLDTCTLFGGAGGAGSNGGGGAGGNGSNGCNGGDGGQGSGGAGGGGGAGGLSVGIVWFGTKPEVDESTTSNTHIAETAALGGVGGAGGCQQAGAQCTAGQDGNGANGLDGLATAPALMLEVPGQ